MAQWQYQVKAEPISTSPETTTVDRWQPVHPTVVRRSVLIAAITAGSFFVGDIPRAEATSIDRWQPTYPNRLDAPRRPFWHGITTTDPVPHAETVTVDRWQPTYPNKINPARRPFWAGLSVIDALALTQSEAVTVDRWQPQYPNRLTPKQRILSIDWSTADAWLAHVPGVETITPDKWAPVYPNRLDRLTRPFWIGQTLLDPKQIIGLDSWEGQRPERLLRRPWRPEAGSVDPDLFHVPQVDTVTVDKWIPVYPNRLDRRARVFWQGAEPVPLFDVAPPAPIPPGEVMNVSGSYTPIMNIRGSQDVITVAARYDSAIPVKGSV